MVKPFSPRELVARVKVVLARTMPKTQEGGEGYLLFFDIDGFKKINDTFGHEAGDEFLVQLGQFFSGIPLLHDAIYRNGGDEFIAIIDGDKTEANIRNLPALSIGGLPSPGG